MNPLVLIGIILLSLALLLVLLVIFFGTLKDLKKTRYPNWTFLDYISVGYFEHLYNKYIKRM